MQGEKLEHLRDGLFMIEGDVKSKKLVSLRADIAVVAFSSTVEVISDFTLGRDFTTPANLSARGQTLMATAILKALQMLHDRKTFYRSERLPYFRPLLAIITDGKSEGEPGDTLESARVALATAVSQKQVQVVSFGVPGVDARQLEHVTGVTPMVVDVNTNWQSMFKFISNSIDAASRPRGTEPQGP
jgi:uncharacterized protein YegL